MADLDESNPDRRGRSDFFFGAQISSSAKVLRDLLNLPVEVFRDVSERSESP
jgi:hypothetical protein